MNALTTETFGENARAALADTQLRGALRNATTLFGTRRRAAARSLKNWEELRAQARAIKEETLLHLDRYLEQFVANAEKCGAKIHWARDGAEANRIICQLVLERNARLVVKSKSMTTEEIHLNAGLQSAGIDVVETDLGEYIIQLAGEVPSHIIVPAIHKTRGQIAKLFSEKLGTQHTDGVADLTATARRVLRQRFAEAEVGISGVNFAIAETGTILILENEGNVRLTSSLPKTHIAVMGIEKLLPRFADLDVFLKLLPRSGTGQHLTTYQSLITGVKRNRTDEGPEELHIVMLDNGRSRMLAHPVTRQSLACIRCGACLNACPVYQQIGGHAYGSIYPGPIGAVITPQLIGLGKAGQLPFASSLCGACREVCPVKIDIPELLLHLRAEIAEALPSSHSADGLRPKQHRGERLVFRLWSGVMTRPKLYGWATRLGRLMQGLVVRRKRIGKLSGAIAHLAPPLGAWTDARDLRPIEAHNFRELWRARLADDTRGAEMMPNAGPDNARQQILDSIRSHLKASQSHDLLHMEQVKAAAGSAELAQGNAFSLVLPTQEGATELLLLDAFAVNLESVGGRCFRVRSEAELARALSQILAGLQTSPLCVRRIAVTEAGIISRAIRQLENEFELVTVSPDAASLFDYDVGITTAQGGIAETGTLVIQSDLEKNRLISLVPPVHIAIVESSTIRWTLGEALAALCRDMKSVTDLSRAITFITGPSRTADIELTLAIGVHGPQELYVIVNEEARAT